MNTYINALCVKKKMLKRQDFVLVAVQKWKMGDNIFKVIHLNGKYFVYTVTHINGEVFVNIEELH